MAVDQSKKKVDFEVRQAREDDLEQIQAIMAAAKWGYSLKSIQDFHRLYAKNMWIAANKEGTVFSFCAAVPVTKDLAFIAFFITKEEFRGMGMGTAVYTASVNEVGKHCNIGVNGALSALSTYERLGFVHGDFDVHWVLGHPNFEDEPETTPPNITVRSADDVPLASILQYDASLQSMSREYLHIDYYLKHEDSSAFCALKGDKVVGYGILLLADDEYKLEPLFADSPEIAWAILVRLVKSLPKGSGIRPMVPDSSEVAKQVFIKAGFSMLANEGPNARRIYTKRKETVPLDKVYSFTSCLIALL